MTLRVVYNGVCTPCGAIFVNTPFQNKYGTATESKIKRGRKMRNDKNNITSGLENIISFSRNITPHFTEKIKIITLVSVIIILSSVNIINTSALSYQSSVGVGFTFNPTLSVSISPSDLVISNLVPGNTLDSNVINVSVASNASYGYTLSAIVNGNNSNLTHSNGTNVFSSIATNADLSDLEDSEDTNIWGYSYKDDTVETPTWSNYNGLSNSNSATLLGTNTNNTETGIDSVDFKIAAKASSTQPSGTYTGTINFTAVTKHVPVTLAEAYASEGKTMINGFYTMQDMTSTICSKVEAIGAQLQVLDERDNKLYWISKLADNHCWMTQNLDLDLDSSKTYTHWDTDLGWETLNESVTWQPINSTASVGNWVNNDTEPYSTDPGDVYYYTSDSKINDTKYTTLQNCKDAGHNDCTHYHAGNYYNWSVAVAGNDTSELTSGNAPNSICPSGWRLPNVANKDFRNLLGKYGIQTGDNAVNIRKEPLYFTRSGQVAVNQRAAGYYWSSTAYRDNLSYDLFFDNTYIYPDNGGSKSLGISLRCLSR